MIRDPATALFTVFLAVFPASCSAPPGEGGAPPSLIKPFVDFPGGSVIRYEDEETANLIYLNDDGSYRQQSYGKFDGMRAERAGVWRWGKLGSHHAELKLDNEVWRLTFVGFESAMAFSESSNRTFAFQFER